MDELTTQLLTEINSSYSKNFTSLTEVPQDILILHLRLTTTHLNYRKRVPNYDDLQNQRTEVSRQLIGLVERYCSLITQMDQIDNKMNPENIPAQNATKTELGKVKSIITRFLWELQELYAPTDPNTGDVLESDTEDINSLCWTIINLIDDELDYGVYHREQVLEEQKTKLGFGDTRMMTQEQKQTLLDAVTHELQEFLEFNIRQLKQGLGFPAE